MVCVKHVFRMLKCTSGSFILLGGKFATRNGRSAGLATLSATRKRGIIKKTHTNQDASYTQAFMLTAIRRAVRKVSSHLEYLENRSRGFDVTWQPVRGDRTVHP
jgi:hypothetical protein